MKVLKQITTLALASVLALGVAAPVFAIANLDEDGNIIENAALPGTNIVPLAIGIGNTDEAEQNASENIETFTGTVVNIVERWNNDGISIRLENEDGAIIELVVPDGIYTIGDEVEIGDVITGIYRVPEVMTMQWPPSYTALVVVNKEYTFINISRYTYELNGVEYNNLVNTDGNIQLNLNDDVPVILADGTEFDGDLEGRMLVVFYDVQNRNMPATTTPSLIVVLFEEAVAPILTLTPGDLAAIGTGTDEGVVAIRPLPGLPGMFTLPPAPPMQPVQAPTLPIAQVDNPYAIVVNGEPIGGNWQILEDYDLPTHVPLRLVAEALDAAVLWNVETRQVMVEGLNGMISFSPGSNVFDVDGETIELDLASINIDGTVYVPINFFRLVFGMTNAYFEGGTMNINNFELMQ